MNVSANFGGLKTGWIATAIFSTSIVYSTVVSGELILFVGQIAMAVLGVIGLSMLAAFSSQTDQRLRSKSADNRSTDLKRRTLRQQLQTQAATLAAISQQLKQEIVHRQQTEERLNSLLDHLNDAVWSMSAKTGEILYLNPAARAQIEGIYGKTGAKILDNPNLWLTAIAPEDRRRYKAMQRGLAAKGSWDLEYRIVQPDGGVRWLRDRARLICDPTGNPLRIDGIIVDITQHKQAEAQRATEILPSNALGQISLAAELWQAIEKQELQLFYQPIVALSTGEIQGFEALSRWYHPQRGWISPAEFIPLAEATGAIFPLGEWVLESACQQMQHWQLQGLLDERTYANVNVSGKQFARKDIVNIVTQVLARTGLDARRLRLEIVEDAICGDVGETIAKLQQLRSLGVQLAIDDFGVGCSSLSRLQRFPIDSLKIDRSFIALLGSRALPRDREIVKTIIALGANLGMQVIAEGIETREQVEQLQQLGCNYGQGYWFSRPTSSEAISSLLRHNSMVCNPSVAH